MNVNKFLAFATAAMLGFVAFGDAANVLISFSSEGPDKYADGSVVADNEWYALVWSADGVFEGLNSDGTPVDSNDVVFLKAPLAKDGKCAPAVFQIDSKAVKASGVYAVCLLDTRKSAGGSPSATFCGINGSKAAATVDAASASVLNGGSVSVAKAGKWEVTGSAEAVKIVDFKVVGASVQIKVADLVPGATYLVNMGATPTEFTSYQIAVPDSEATFNIKCDDSRFFNVIRR